MSLRSQLKQIAAKGLLRMRSPLEGKYDSFAAASAAAARHSTYENATLIELVAAKTLAYRQHLEDGSRAPTLHEREVRFGLALQRAARGKRTLQVVDFGGACGAHYYLGKHLLGPEVSLT